MATTTPNLHFTKSAAIAATFALAGGFSVVSLMTIPAFLLAPAQVAANQFACIYRIGVITQPPLTVATALLHGYVAYRLRQQVPNQDAAWKYWATSGVLVGAVLPWTFGLMEPVSQRALGLAEREGGKGVGNANGKGKEEIFALLRRWNAFNVGRSALAMAAGAAAMYCF